MASNKPCRSGKKTRSFTVSPCRNKKGRFVAKKGAAPKRRKRRMNKKAVCKPNTTRRYKGRCGCKTKGGGFKFKPASSCKRKRRR